MFKASKTLKIKLMQQGAFIQGNVVIFSILILIYLTRKKKKEILKESKEPQEHQLEFSTKRLERRVISTLPPLCISPPDESKDKDPNHYCNPHQINPNKENPDQENPNLKPSKNNFHLPIPYIEPLRFRIEESPANAASSAEDYRGSSQKCRPVEDKNNQGYWSSSSQEDVFDDCNQVFHELASGDPGSGDPGSGDPGSQEDIFDDCIESSQEGKDIFDTSDDNMDNYRVEMARVDAQRFRNQDPSLSQQHVETRNVEANSLKLFDGIACDDKVESTLFAASKAFENVTQNNSLTEPPLSPVSKPVKIQYQNRDLTEIPSIIKNDFGPFLKTLNLSKNKIREIPPEIRLLENIAFLYFRQNNLTMLPPEFSQLKNLVICDLAENMIQEIKPCIFKGWKTLQILDLSKNLLQKLPLSLGPLKSLQTLLISGNRFDKNLKTLVDPLIESYMGLNDNQDYTKHYLFRLQGYLSDALDLENASVHFNRTESRIHRIPFQMTNLKLHYNTSTGSAENPSTPSQTLLVIKEIYKTELVYVSDLDAIHSLYMKPLHSHFKKHHFEILFSNLDEIRILHKRTILPAFLQACQDSTISVSQIFNDICPLLTRYAIFLNNYSLSVEFLETLANAKIPANPILLWTPVTEVTHQAFSRIEKVARKNKAHTQINLSSFLMLPIQRIPRYKLLLKSLIDHTPASHRDYAKLHTALDSVSSLLDYLNMLKMKSEFDNQNLSPLFNLQIDWPFFETILDRFVPARKLVHTFDSLFLVKLVVSKKDALQTFNSNFLCSKKKGQYMVDELGVTLVTRFKLPTMIPLIQETAPSISRFDLLNARGKKCKVTVCSDTIFISNLLRNKLSGCIRLPLTCRAISIPITNTVPLSAGPNLVIRITDGHCVAFLKGNIQDIALLESLLV